MANNTIVNLSANPIVFLYLTGGDFYPSVFAQSSSFSTL